MSEAQEQIAPPPSLQEEGGTEWEARKAWALISEGRKVGDEDKERLGWSRWGDAMRNKVVGSLSDQLVPMLLELRGIREDRSADAKVFEHKLDLLMDLAEAEQARGGRTEARLGLMEQRLNSSLESGERTGAQMLIDLETIRTKLKDIRTEIQRVQFENLQDQLNREERLRLTEGLRKMLERWPEVEALLDRQGG